MLSLRSASPCRVSIPHHGDAQSVPARTSAPATHVKSTGYHCQHHGANGTHDTWDCFELNGQQGKSCKERAVTRRHGDAMMSARATATFQPLLWDERRQPSAHTDSEQQAERLQCPYCKRYGHVKVKCVILHPELANPGWLPTGAMPRAMFPENQGKGAGGARPSGSSSSNRNAHGRPWASEAASAGGSQLRQVNIATCMTGDCDFEDEDFTL